MLRWLWKRNKSKILALDYNVPTFVFQRTVTQKYSNYEDNIFIIRYTDVILKKNLLILSGGGRDLSHSDSN